MAKKGQAQLQIDCENEEDWEKLVERSGLIVVDVYSDWCGPCTGMSGNLRKLKLEIGGDALTIATAKCDNIECLKRFRNKSEPTWMFISGGKMIRLMFGANAPRLISIVTEEFNKEMKAISDNVPREGIRFDQLTDEEQERVDEETRLQEEAEENERLAREMEILERREAVVQNLLEPLREMMFVLVFPHCNHEQTTKISDSLKELGLNVGKSVRARIGEANLNEMLYYQTWPIEDEVLEIMTNEEFLGIPCVGVYEEDETQPTLIQKILHKFYGEMRAPPGDEDSLAAHFVKVKQIEKPKTEAPEDAGNADENEGEKTPEMIELRIPGIYIPQNEKVKVLGMRFLFPLIVGKFDLPEPEPIPPHLIIAFDAFKRNEVLPVSVEYPTETMCMGFFTTHNPETAILIAKSPEQFDNLSVKPYGAKLVIQVSKKKSEPLLSYSILGPSYVSPNCIVGEKESELFFPEEYFIPEPEPEEPKKKSKKRFRGSKASVSSSETRISDLSENVEEELEEEIMDEILEENLDDDDGLDFLGDYQEPVDIIGGSESEATDKATSPPPPEE